MGKNTNFVSHKKSKLKENGGPKLPLASDLVEGEIAINFGKDVETLSIKNESGDVVTFSSDNYYTEKKLGSGFTGENSANTVTSVIESNEKVTALALADLDERKLDKSDLSDYYKKKEIDDLVGSGFSSSSITEVIIENKEEINKLVGSGFSSSSITEVITENEEIVSTALIDLDERKLDASAYTPSVELWVSGTGLNSVVLKGSSGTASGNYSVAEGYQTSAMSQYSHVEGRNTFTTGYGGEHAEGNSTSGITGSHAEGYGTIAINYSHAEGYSTKALSDYSHAEGYSSSAISYSHAEGYQTIAINYSHAEGFGTTASSQYSHAEGYSTKASGETSHAEGTWTEANGSYSHAEGNSTKARGDYGSHAEGSYTEANGSYSHAEGYKTAANNQAEHASGQYNISSSASTRFGDSGNTLFSVGNGSSTTPHNAFEIRQNGDIYISSGGTDIKLQDYIGSVETVTAITPSNSGSTDPIATKVVAENELTVSNALTDLDTRKLDASAYTPTDLSNYYTKYETSGATEISNALGAKVNNATFTAHTADTNVHFTTNDRLKWETLNRRTRKNFTASGMTYFTNTLKSAIADQDLEKYGLKVGDYCSATHDGKTYNYVIAGLNTMKGIHSYRLTIDHVGIIVDTNDTHAWNSDGTTTSSSGYANSDLHNYLKGTILPNVKDDLVAENIKTHKKLLTIGVNPSGYNRFGSAGGCSSNWDWSDESICALSEVQVYGSIVWSSSGFDTGEACRQLDVFRVYNMNEIFEGRYPWLRDVASASNACYVNGNGSATNNPASYARYVAALILFA